MNEQYLICFHTSCIDGFASAWCVYDALNKEGVKDEDMEFIPCDYGDPIPDMTGKVVYIADFSWYDVDALLTEVTKAERVVMIDHHIGAQKVWAEVKLPKNMLYVYSDKESGIGLTWDYFHSGQPMPLILSHIQDRDLWKWSITGSPQVHAVLKSEGFMSREKDQRKLREKFLRFSKYAFMWKDEEITRLLAFGVVIERAESALIDLILERTSTFVDFPTYKDDPNHPGNYLLDATYRVPVAEVPYDLASEAGDKLNQGYPFSVTYETQWALGRRKFSIRSNKETGIDVVEIAKQQGGAGHKHAAGWIEPIIGSDDFPWNFVKKFT